MTDATQQLRKLLDDYYSGQTSPDTIREIVRLFSELTVVPPDLLVDQQIFMATEQLSETLPPAPDRLEQIITQTIDSCQKSQRRSRPILFRWIAASGAAAALIALLFSIGRNLATPEQSSPDRPGGPSQFTSETPNVKPQQENKPNPNAEFHPHINPTQQLIAQTDVHSPGRPSTNENASSASSTNHVITDPIEAARRLDAVIDKLERNISLSAKTQSEALDALNLANEKASNILTTSLQ